MDAFLWTIVILSVVILVILILMGLGMDGDKFKSRFMRNPVRINVLHVKSSKIWSKLYNIKFGEKNINDSKETTRILNWDYAYGHRGISNFYYVGDSSEPVKFDDFKTRISANEMHDLATLFMTAGATDYVPLLVKEVIKAVLPFLILTLILTIITLVVGGITLTNQTTSQTAILQIKNALQLVKNATITSSTLSA